MVCFFRFGAWLRTTIGEEFAYVWAFYSWVLNGDKLSEMGMGSELCCWLEKKGKWKHSYVFLW